MMYAMPMGVKCLVSANNGETSLRDKSGSIITTMNTLLPNGSKLCHEDKITLLQGIYNPSTKVLYITDIMMWDDELCIDLVGCLRLQIAFDKISEIPGISNSISEMNEVMIRFPSIYHCSKEGLSKSYYGLYTDFSSPTFNARYTNLVNCAIENGLITTESITTIKPPLLCAMFGYDNLGHPYTKDGIAFIKKDGGFVFGFSAECLLWKNQEISPIHFSRLRKFPITAKLIYTERRKLRTYDGYNIVNFEDREHRLQVNARYIVEFENAAIVDNWKVELFKLRIIKETSSIIWDTIMKILYKCMAVKQDQIKIEDIEKFLSQ